MKLLILACLAVSAYAAYYEDLVAENSKLNDGFSHGYSPRFAGYTLERIQKMMGTKLDQRPGVPIKRYAFDASVPSTFVSGVDKWKMCASTIGYIKDQADCGSCWAVSASSVVGDRTCIANMASMTHAELLAEGQPPIDMSAADIMDCCSWCGSGCQGGYPADAMRYWNWDGVVTGGWYGSMCGCAPYQIPPCGPNGCSGPEANTPRCRKTCYGKNGLMWKTSKHYGSDHYQIEGNVNALQQEIMNNGPIECAFTVYSNFMDYNGGVYMGPSGRELGGHAVTIIGWGNYKGTNYWLINNSWNITWGIAVAPPNVMGGQFMFKRGGDVCGMESQCVAGKAKTGDSTFKLQC